MLIFTTYSECIDASQVWSDMYRFVQKKVSLIIIAITLTTGTYCQPIFIIFGTYTPCETCNWSLDDIVSPPNTVCVTALPCKILFDHDFSHVCMFTTINAQQIPKNLYIIYNSCL